MQWLVRISVKHLGIPTVLILVVLVLGATSYGSLGLDMFPTIALPIETPSTRS